MKKAGLIKRFWRDERGNATLWTLFAILVLIMICVVIYISNTVYSKHASVQNELTRSAAVTIDANVVNPNLRDVILNVEQITAANKFQNNMLENGWRSEGNGWARYSSGKLVSRLDNCTVMVTNDVLHITATHEIPLPWEYAGQASVKLPIDIYARILYIG